MAILVAVQQHVPGNADATIAHAYGQVTPLEAYRNLGGRGVCMMGDVEHRLAHDPGDFRDDQRIHGPLPAFHDDAHRNGWIEWRVSHEPFDDRAEVLCAVVAAQATDAVAGIHHDIVGGRQRGLQLSFRLLFMRQAVGDRVEAQDQPLDTLQQGVMQFTRNALPLGDALLEPAADAAGYCATRRRYRPHRPAITSTVHKSRNHSD